MKDHPIIFSGPMVRALLDGRKTMTRRLASSPLRKCAVGDRLWVRETFMYPNDQITIYRATWREDAKRDRLENVPKDEPTGWTPCIHMPRSASRLTLVVTATKVERLQQITGNDAMAEGIEATEFYVPKEHGSFAFRRLWESLHGAGSWAANPELVALTFTVHRQNIDALPKAA